MLLSRGLGLRAARLHYGDLGAYRPGPASMVADQVGIEDVRAEMTPQVKLQCIHAWRAAGKRTQFSAQSSASLFIGLAEGWSSAKKALPLGLIFRPLLGGILGFPELERRECWPALACASGAAATGRL